MNSRATLKKATKHVETDRCGFDRTSSISCDTYVCTCGWPFQGQEYEVIGRKLRYARKQIYTRTRKR